jgi:hypothetical protein
VYGRPCIRPFSLNRSFLLLLACLVGCGSGLRVTSIQLGRSLNADDTVASHTTTFAPGDTVYVSVIIDGTSSGVIGVRWMYGERVLGEPTKQVRGAGATEFHLQSTGGFPPGDYTVEVFLDGQSAGTRSFRVDTQR